MKSLLYQKERTEALPGEKAQAFCFPGRWVGGISLILAPLALLAGVLLRLPFHFFFPDQLAAYATYPRQMFAAYSLFAAGIVLLWPAVISLAQHIGERKPGWALWGGTLAILGLFARTFHAGVDHLAFQLVKTSGVEAATKAIADSYGAFHIFKVLSAAILLGWVVLAAGSFLSGTMGLFRSLALGLTAGMPLGVLKGTTPFSVVSAFCLCIALIPLGVDLLCSGQRPKLRNILGWGLLLASLGIAFYFVGQAG